MYKFTWKDNLSMYGYEAPKDWSGHKCKKVFQSLVGLRTKEEQAYWENAIRS